MTLPQTAGTQQYEHFLSCASSMGVPSVTSIASPFLTSPIVSAFHETWRIRKCNSLNSSSFQGTTDSVATLCQ